MKKAQKAEVEKAVGLIEAPALSQPEPQKIVGCTFTEEEAKKFADFLNLVFTKASWSAMTSQEAADLTRSFAFMQGHMKKIESFIFEPLQAQSGKKK